MLMHMALPTAPATPRPRPAVQHHHGQHHGSHRRHPARSATAAGAGISFRPGGPGDVSAALAMHQRCSPRTLGLRYHGPVADAGRYLDHLLSPNFGQSLAAQTANGTIVGLGHLLWDGDEGEVALLVEDAWQRRGIGGELLRRLVGLAVQAGCESIYAVTQVTNSGMVALMRRLALPLEYQVQDGTLLIGAGLPPAGSGAAAAV